MGSDFLDGEYRYKNLLADHTQGGKDNSFKQQPLAGVLSQAEISKEGGSGWVFRGRRLSSVVISSARLGRQGCDLACQTTRPGGGLAAV